MDSWRREAIYHDGDRYFADLCAAIERAQSTIDFESYIFDRDVLGKQVLDHLIGAARRGVRVRLLLDGVGSYQWSASDLQEVRRQGVELRFFHPLSWQNTRFRFLRLFLSQRRFMAGMRKLNRRNHRKTCIIDRETAFLGGMNVSARHSRKESGSSAWRDTSIQVAGEEVARISGAFRHAWEHPRALAPRWARAESEPLPKANLVQLNLSRKERKAKYAVLLKRILGARTRVWIVNPYFVPDPSLVRALRFSAWSGVDVRMIFPRESDVWGMRWMIRAFYMALLSARVRVFEYGASVLHAKIMLIDDRASVGSSNLNHRSLIHDLEIDVDLTHASSIRSIEERFLADLAASREIDPLAWARRSWMKKLLERALLIFRRWM